LPPSFERMDEALQEALLQRPGAVAGRDRDHELVCYVGRHGAVTIGDVMKATGVGRTVAYRRVARCMEAGLIERLAILHSEPSVLRATPQGLQYAGLGLPLAEISPGSVIHSLRCASIAHALCEHFGVERVLTEREVIQAERIEERPVASAEVGTLPSGAPQLHRPDLAVLTDAGVLAIEVELTPKSPTRLAKIIASWWAAKWVKEVQYVTPAGPTRRAVKRAVAKVEARGRVKVLDEVPW